MHYSIFLRGLLRLSSLLSYYIPRDGDLSSYREYIESLPIVDSPEAFGQHSNAEMASMMGFNRIVCDTLMVLQGQSTIAEENKEEKVLALSTEILKKIPDQIDYDSTVKNIGIKRSPMEVVLLQEVHRNDVLSLNDLLRKKLNKILDYNQNKLITVKQIISLYDSYVLRSHAIMS